MRAAEIESVLRFGAQAGIRRPDRPGALQEIVGILIGSTVLDRVSGAKDWIKVAGAEGGERPVADVVGAGGHATKGRPAGTVRGDPAGEGLELAEMKARFRGLVFQDMDVSRIRSVAHAHA